MQGTSVESIIRRRWSAWRNACRDRKGKGPVLKAHDYLRGLLASEFPNCETPPAQIDASQGDWVAEAMARMEGMRSPL